MSLLVSKTNSARMALFTRPLFQQPPFPWFGGKSRAAHLVWERFGNVPNYVEPFAGSLATLLARPHAGRAETVNDKDCFLANFWRAVQWAPAETAQWADSPVNEADLHARHHWLVTGPKAAEFRARMERDPHYYDAQVAGWWVWGLCQWIGAGWCAFGAGNRTAASLKAEGLDGRRPHLTKSNGVHRKLAERRPRLTHNYKRLAINRGGRGIERKLVSLYRSGKGVHRSLPAVGGKRSGAGRGVHRLRPELQEWFSELSGRLRRVRVCCGDWRRVLTRTPTTYIGLTGILLDPPYGTGRDRDLYAHDNFEVAAHARAWAIEHGADRRMRIALCGLAGQFEMPKGWTAVGWASNGGYGNRSNGSNGNRWREVIWFSPNCLTPGKHHGKPD